MLQVWPKSYNMEYDSSVSFIFNTILIKIQFPFLPLASLFDSFQALLIKLIASSSSIISETHTHMCIYVQIYKHDLMSPFLFVYELFQADHIVLNNWLHPGEKLTLPSLLLHCFSRQRAIPLIKAEDSICLCR